MFQIVTRKYENCIEELYDTFREDVQFVHLLTDIAYCVKILLSSKKITEVDNSSDHLENFVKFVAISLEYLQFLVKERSEFPVESVDILLASAEVILHQNLICRLLDAEENQRWFCSCVNSIFYVVERLLMFDKPLPTIPNYLLKQYEKQEIIEADLSPENKEAVEAAEKAVHKLYVLMTWFNELKCINLTKIPQFLFNPIKTITVSLSRLPIANSYLLIPLKAWKTGWTPEKVCGIFKTHVPAIPIEVLQDVEVLEEYIFR